MKSSGYKDLFYRAQTGRKRTVRRAVYSVFKNLVLRARSTIIGFAIENSFKQIRSTNIGMFSRRTPQIRNNIE